MAGVHLVDHRVGRGGRVGGLGADQAQPAAGRRGDPRRPQHRRLGAGYGYPLRHDRARRVEVEQPAEGVHHPQPGQRDRAAGQQDRRPGRGRRRDRAVRLPGRQGRLRQAEQHRPDSVAGRREQVKAGGGGAEGGDLPGGGVVHLAGVDPVPGLLGGQPGGHRPGQPGAGRRGQVGPAGHGDRRGAGRRPAGTGPGRAVPGRLVVDRAELPAGQVRGRGDGQLPLQPGRDPRLGPGGQRDQVRLDPVEQAVAAQQLQGGRADRVQVAAADGQAGSGLAQVAAGRVEAQRHLGAQPGQRRGRGRRAAGGRGGPGGPGRRRGSGRGGPGGQPAEQGGREQQGLADQRGGLVRQRAAGQRGDQGGAVQQAGVALRDLRPAAAAEQLVRIAAAVAAVPGRPARAAQPELRVQRHEPARRLPLDRRRVRRARPGPRGRGGTAAGLPAAGRLAGGRGRRRPGLGRRGLPGGVGHGDLGQPGLGEADCLLGQEAAHAHPRAGVDEGGRRGPVRRGGLRRRRAGRHRRPAGQHPVGDRRLARGHSGEPRLVLALVDGDQAVRAGQAGQQAGREGGEQPLDAAPGVPGAAEHVGQPGRDQVVHVIAGHDPDRGRAGPQIGREGVPGDRDPGQRHTEHGAVQERGRFHAGPGADNPGGRFAGQAGRADRLVGGHGRDVRGPGGGRRRRRPPPRPGRARRAGLRASARSWPYQPPYPAGTRPGRPGRPAGPGCPPARCPRHRRR